MSQPSPPFEASIAHRAAAAVLLRDRTGWPVYEDGPPNNPTYPHYVLWGAADSAFEERMRGSGGEAVTTMQVTVVAVTVDDVLGGYSRARRALHRRRPTIPGRRCGDITVEDTTVRPVINPADRTPDGRQIYTLPLIFTVHTNPIRGDNNDG